MKSGIKPIIPDKRDLSFKATFGAVTAFPDSFNSNFNTNCPDQNADGFPYGCSGYTQAEVCGDEDKAVYDPAYTYDKTLLIEGNQGKQVGCELRNSLKTTLVYGVQVKDANNADNNRRGAYYNVDKTSDYFDGARSAMLTYSQLWGKPCSISVGSRWCLNFNSTGTDGIIKYPDPTQFSIYSLHNWKVCGWKTIDGVPYLIGKAWQGNTVGDSGWLYFSRELYNALINDYFAGAYVLAPYKGETLTIRLTTLEVIVSMLARAGFNGETLGKIALLLEKALHL